MPSRRKATKFITPIIVANSDRFPDMQLEEQGSVKVGTTIIYLSKQA
ncbi:hypothetical protein [Paenibacillus sp. DCT19]|nr:hypothetical protein [Paenibacillus sp. DCT19]